MSQIVAPQNVDDVLKAVMNVVPTCENQVTKKSFGFPTLTMVLKYIDKGSCSLLAVILHCYLS